MRSAIEPKMAALIEEVKAAYGAERCGYPYVPIVRESYVEGPRIMICGKGAGSWGLRYAGIEGIGPKSTLADVPEGNWYPEVLKTHEAFIEGGAKKYLSGEKGGYARGAWWRSLYSVVVHVFRDRKIGESWSPSLRNPEDAEFFFSNVALTNLDKVARRKNNLDLALRKIHDRYYTLAEEIEVLKPRLIWFPTGPSYDAHLKKALPGASFRDVDDGVAEVEGLGRLALRTYHPQYTKRFNARRFTCYLTHRV